MPVLILAFSLVIISVPRFFLGFSLPSLVLSLAPFGYLALISFGTARRTGATSGASPGVLALWFGLLAVSCAAVLRTARPDGTELLVLLLLIGVSGSIWLLFMAELDVARRSDFVRALAWAPAVFVIVNEAMYLVGFRRESANWLSAGDQASMLQLLGISGPRTSFPLAEGLNTFGVLAAIGFACVVVLRADQVGIRRRLHEAAAVLCMAGVLLTDTRAALVASLLALAATRWVPRLRAMQWAALLMPLGSFLMGLAEPLIRVVDLGTRDSAVSSAARQAVRSSVEAVAFQVSPNLLYGWGLWGQIPSGAWLGQAQLFYNRFGSSGGFYSAHSFVLQTMLDVGLVGLVLTVALVFACLRRFGSDADRGDQPARALVAAILVLILVGFTESLPSLDVSLLLTIWFLSQAAAAIRSSVTATARSTSVAGSSDDGWVAPSWWLGPQPGPARRA